MVFFYSEVMQAVCNAQMEKSTRTRCTLLTAFFKEAWRNVLVKWYIRHLHNWFMLLRKNRNIAVYNETRRSKEGWKIKRNKNKKDPLLIFNWFLALMPEYRLSQNLVIIFHVYLRKSSNPSAFLWPCAIHWLEGQSSERSQEVKVVVFVLRRYHETVLIRLTSVTPTVRFKVQFTPFPPSPSVLRFTSAYKVFP